MSDYNYCALRKLLRICLLPALKDQDQSLAASLLEEGGIHATLSFHSVFTAIEEEQFLDSIRVLAALEKVSTYYSRSEFRKN